MLSVCTVELHITVNNMKVFIVTQNYFLGELISPAAIRRPWVFVCISLCFCSILTKLDFLDRFSYKCQYQISRKFLAVRVG